MRVQLSPSPLIRFYRAKALVKSIVPSESRFDGIRRGNTILLTITSILPRPRLNNQIRVSQVRLIDDAGENIGVVDIKKALEMAYEKHLDLVEISPTAVPPVARIIDFGKYLYQLEKQVKKQKAKHKTVGMKLIKISLRIAENDSLTKIRKLEEFLEEGHKVKVDMFLRGRERANMDFAKGRFQKFLDMIKAPHKVEQSLKKLPSGFTTVLSK